MPFKAEHLLGGREIPHGWSVRTISEVADVNARSVGAKTAPETIRYVDISSVGTREMEPPVEMPYADAPSRARRVVRKGDTLVSTVRPNRRQFVYMDAPGED